ncbi:MAG: hypothetical protein ABR499_14385 [Gemmatimonadaceae bacterium]
MQSTTRARPRAGIALAAVLFALAVVSVLLTGVFWVTVQDQRMGENARRRQQSLGAAEVGVAEVLRMWDRSTRNSIRFYPDDSIVIGTRPTPHGTGEYSARVFRLATDMYFVDVTGTDPLSAAGAIRGSGSRQRLGALVRTTPSATIAHRAAFTTTGAVKIRDAALIDGGDRRPDGWVDCPPPETAVAGILTDADATVDKSETASVLGQPASAATLSAADTAALSATYASLASYATIVLSAGAYTPQPAVLDGACDHAALTNWGDGLTPSAPCGRYFPIIRVSGDLHIDNGVQGQGILLVDGNLHVNGPFRFIGVVLVRGAVKFGGNAAGAPAVVGMMISRKNGSPSPGADSLANTATVTYSRCAVESALRTSRRPSLIRSRSWAQLF